MYELSDHDPRGYAIIFNISKNREGSEKDVRVMAKLFADMNYQVTIKQDETKEVTASEQNHFSV